RTDWSSLSDAFMFAAAHRPALCCVRPVHSVQRWASQSRKPMPTQEVARAACPWALLRRGGPAHRGLLGGGGPDSWLSGKTLYTHDPAATLVVYPSGWGRSTTPAGVDRWSWGDPLTQWEAFLAAGRAALGDQAEGAGFLTVLSYDLKHWIERLPR